MFHRYFSYTLLTVLTVNLLGLCGELTLTWTSPTLPKLHLNDTELNPLPRPITHEEESWIGSLINIGAIIGPFPFGFLSEKMGRKFTLLTIAIPHILAFFILGFLHDLAWYYTARLLSGVALGAGCVLLPLYISEIAEDSNRGTLSVTLNIFFTFGNLVPYLLGPYLDTAYFNLTLALIPCAFFVLFFLVGPESPYYLVSRGRIFDAQVSLMKLRSKTVSEVNGELVSIQTELRQGKPGNFQEMFTIKANLKALGISVALMSFQQLSGVNVVVFYTQLIFQESGSSLSPEYSAIIVGLTLFGSSLIIPFFADSFNRRFFLILSGVMMAVFLAIFGAYFYVKNTQNTNDFNWVPIFSLVFYIISFNLGFSIFPWTISAELFPTNIKPFGTAFVSFTCWFLSFIITKFFNDLNQVLGISGTFWLFAGFCLLGAVFTSLWVPETRGKSFQQIQALLRS